MLFDKIQKGYYRTVTQLSYKQVLKNTKFQLLGFLISLQKCLKQKMYYNFIEPGQLDKKRNITYLVPHLST